MEKVHNRTSPQGPNGETKESSAAINGQPTQDASAQPPQQSMGGQPIQQQNPYQAMPNRPTYGELAFGSFGVPPGSTYRVAPANNRLQKNMYGTGY
jgi:hypothetical protein